MPQKRTYILLVIALLSTLASVGMFLFAFNVIKHKNQYASALSQTIQERVIEEENASEFTKVIEETKEKQEKIKSFIVDQEKIDEFATYIEGQGDKVNIPIVIRNVEILATLPNTLSMSFDGIGSFENVMRLIWTMENAPYKITIQNLSMVANLESNWQVSMRIEVTSNQFK